VHLQLQFEKTTKIGLMTSLHLDGIHDNPHPTGPHAASVASHCHGQLHAPSARFSMS
jgi:hypothetical protein